MGDGKRRVMGPIWSRVEPGGAYGSLCPWCMVPLDGLLVAKATVLASTHQDGCGGVSALIEPGSGLTELSLECAACGQPMSFGKVS